MMQSTDSGDASPSNQLSSQSPDPLSAPSFQYRSPAGSTSLGSYSSVPSVDQLEFQDIAHTHANQSVNLDINDNVPLNSDSKLQSTDASTAQFWTLNYYKPFCAMSSDAIIGRLYRSIAPWKGQLFNDEEPADLYGPWWVATTLILVVAIASNLSSYVYAHRNSDVEKSDEDRWRFDFQCISVMTSIVYSIISWLAVFVYWLLARAGQSTPLVNCVGILGYSLTPMLLSSLLLMIPVSILQWIIVASTAALQCYFVFINLWHDRSNTKVSPVIMGVFAGYAGLALLFKWYFFPYAM